MSAWRRAIRFALAAFIVGLGAAVLFGLRDRVEPTRTVVVDRSDPDAVIQMRGSRIVRADSFGEHLQVVADRQFTYPDGRLRMIEGVTVTVADREDREGFILVGNEASVDAGKTQINIIGGVQLTSGDGLSATTEEASYADGDGVVRMPGEARFMREGMDAYGLAAEYDRSQDLLRLLAGAEINLTADTDTTRITSQTATVAQAEGYMQFKGGVSVNAGSQQMNAAQARASFVEEVSHLEALELQGEAYIRGSDPGVGRLREMSAPGIMLAYDKAAQHVEQAILTSGAALQLYGADGVPGAQLTGQSIDVRFAEGGSGVAAVSARDEVFLDVPERPAQPAQRVSADAFDAAGEDGQGLEQAKFDGAVEYRETRTSDGTDLTLVARSERLHATLADGLSTLEGARFLGEVTFSDSEVSGWADEAFYLVGEGTVELLTVGPEGQTPRVIDQRGSVQAETIQLMFDGPNIEARGGVESVLSGESGDGTSENFAKRPQLFGGDEAVLVTADHLSYERETEIATYTGSAHLWQGETEFRGGQIVLDESTGNIRVEGNVRTRSMLKQIDDETGVPEEAITTGRSQLMEYDDAARRVTYTTDAQVSGPRGNLAADIVEVYLQSDSKTLDRLEASGHVELETRRRFVSGATLVYHDADGRYEMAGKPVRIIEELEEECRETTGRTLTFFITGDELSVDGQAEVRTQTASGECADLKRVNGDAADH